MTIGAIDLIRGYYKAFNAGVWEDLLALLAEDVAHDLNQGPREVGRDAFRAFLARQARCYRERLSNIVIVCASDAKRAAVEYRVSGEYLATDDGLPPARGQTYALQGGTFFEMRPGEITRVTNYYNLQDWVKQIG